MPYFMLGQYSFPIRYLDSKINQALTKADCTSTNQHYTHASQLQCSTADTCRLLIDLFLTQSVNKVLEWTRFKILNQRAASKSQFKLRIIWQSRIVTSVCWNTKTSISLVRTQQTTITGPNYTIFPTYFFYVEYNTVTTTHTYPRSSRTLSHESIFFR